MVGRIFAISEPVYYVPLSVYVDDVVVVLGAGGAPDKVMVCFPDALPGEAGRCGVGPG